MLNIPTSNYPVPDSSKAPQSTKAPHWPHDKVSEHSGNAPSPWRKIVTRRISLIHFSKRFTTLYDLNIQHRKLEICIENTYGGINLLKEYQCLVVRQLVTAA